MRNLWPIGLLASLCACGPTPEEVCEVIDERCGFVNFTNCLEDGEDLEQRSDDADCDDQFDTYIFCVDDDPCTSDTRCMAAEQDLRDCVGEFPAYGR